MFKSIKSKLGLALGAVTAFSASAMAAVSVDLTQATQDIETAGNAMIALAVTILGIAIVWSFLRKRG